MSELLSGGKIHKHPSESVYGSTFSVSAITTTGTNLYTITIINKFGTKPFILNETVYLHGYYDGKFCHPIKCKVKVAQADFYEVQIEKLVSYAIPVLSADPNNYGLFISRNYTTDLISASMDSFFDFETYEFEAGITGVNGAVVEFNIIGGSPANDYDWFKIKFVELTTGQIIYLTKQIYLVNGTTYGFVDDLYQIIGTSFETNSDMTIQHIDCKYLVDIYSNDIFTTQLIFTPNKDFRFCFNFKSVLSSLFDKKLFEDFVNPLSTSFSNLQDLSEIFVKKVRFDITLTSPNVNGNRSNSLQFFTTPIMSTTGRASLEEYLSSDGFVISKKVNPFTTLKYQNGVGGFLGFMGGFIRNRSLNDTRTIYSNDNVTTDTTIDILKNTVSFIAYSNKYTSSQAPTIVQILETLYIEEQQVQYVLFQENIKLIADHTNEVNIIWTGDSGIGQWFFNCEYDEDWNTTNVVKVSNPIKNTITRYNTRATRKISLKAEHLELSDMRGIATLIEAKQAWIYSYTQSRLIPIDLSTSQMKVRTADEVRYTATLDFELERSVTL